MKVRYSVCVANYSLVNNYIYIFSAYVLIKYSINLPVYFMLKTLTR